MQTSDAVKAVTQAAGYCNARYAARLAFEAAHAGSLLNPRQRCAYAIATVGLGLASYYQGSQEVNKMQPWW